MRSLTGRMIAMGFIEWDPSGRYDMLFRCTWLSRTPTFTMAQNKTKFTDASVEDYIAARGNEQQRADCRELIALLKKITRQPPKMWGPSIVGFGSFRYKY